MMSNPPHPELVSRLEAVIAERLGKITVKDNAFLDVESYRKLLGISSSLPKKDNERYKRWLGSDPLAIFVYYRLSREIRSREAKLDLTNSLSDLDTHRDLRSVSARYVREFFSLPIKYQFFCPLFALPGKLSSAIPDDGLSITSEICLIRGLCIPEKFTTVGEENQPEPFAGPFGIGLLGSKKRPGPWQWNPVVAYLWVEMEGFLCPEDDFRSPTIESFERIVRSVSGTLLALEAAEFHWLYSRGTYPVFIYTDGNDSTLEPTEQNIHGEFADRLSALSVPRELNPDNPRNAIAYAKLLRHLPDAFSYDSKVAKAAQWLFDSFCYGNQLLAFIQAAVVLEILFGDKSTAADVGITRLIGNRCAYYLGRNEDERVELLDRFEKAYDIRSRIVHGGHNVLTPEEQEHLVFLRVLSTLSIRKKLREVNGE